MVWRISGEEGSRLGKLGETIQRRGRFYRDNQGYDPDWRRLRLVLSVKIIRGCFPRWRNELAFPEDPHRWGFLLRNDGHICEMPVPLLCHHPDELQPSKIRANNNDPCCAVISAKRAHVFQAGEIEGEIMFLTLRHNYNVVSSHSNHH